MTTTDDLDDFAGRVATEFNTVRGEVTTGLGGKAATSHVHAAGDTTSGTFAIARIPTGTSSSTVTIGNDSRLSDARVPNGWVDVVKAGATGNGSTDDTTAIQNAIDGAATGATIWFPGGTYLVSTTVRLKPGLRYIGAGGRPGMTTIKAAGGLSGGAVVAGKGWYDNADSVGRVHVEGLFIDASSVSGAHGLVVFSFWSTYRDIQVANVAGSGAHGIHVTDRCRNGSTTSTSSHSENVFQSCRLYDHTSGADGFYQESNNGFSNQDGHLENCFFASMGGFGIYLGRAAGWTVFDNHLYGIGKDGIQAWNCYATKIIGNYVEDMGGADAASSYYNGICLATVLNTRASVVANNTVSTSQPSSPTGAQWACYYARAGSTQLYANVVFTGNTAVFSSSTAPSVSKSWAYRFGEGGDSGRLLAVEWAGNQIQNVAWWQGTRYVAGTVTVTEPTTPDLSGYVPAARTVSAGTGLTGGGDLSANRTLTVAYGTSSSTACVGNDARLSDTRTPTAHKTSHATGGGDAITPSDIGAQPVDSDLTTIAGLTATTDNMIQSVGSAWASRTPAQVRTALAVQATSEKGAASGYAGLDSGSRIAASAAPLVSGTPQAQTIATTVSLDASTGSIHDVQSSTATLAVSVPSNPTNRQVLRCGFKRSTAAALTVNLNASIRLSTGLASRAFVLASGEVLLCALEYSSLVGAWALTAATIVAAS